MKTRHLTFLLMVVICPFFMGCGTSADDTQKDRVPFKSYIVESFEGDKTDYITLPVSEKFKPYDLSPFPHNDENTKRKYIVKLIFQTPGLQDTAIFLPSLYYPVEMFLNGKKIFRSGLTGKKESYSNFYGAMVQLPETLLNKQKENTIAISLSPGYEKRSFRNMFISSHKNVLVYKFWYSFFHCMLPLVFSALSLVYFVIFFSLWMSGRYKTKTYLYFSFICCALVFSYLNMIFSGINVNEIFLTKLSRASFNIAALLLLVFSVEYTNTIQKKRTFHRLISAIIISLMIAYLFFTETRHDIKKLFDITSAIVIAPALTIVPLIITRSWVKTRRPGTLLLMLAIYLLVASAIHDLIYRKQHVEAFIWMLPVGYLCVEFAISFILSMEQAYMTKKIARQAKVISLANEELIHATKIAEDANKTKTAFLANMAHEFRTPLNGIEGELQVLKDSATEHSVEHINNIAISSKRLMASINEVIDFSELESGELALDISAFKIIDRLNNIPGLIASDIEGKNLNFNFNIDQSVPEFIEGDEKRIKRIILGLLENSLKFTKSGSISLGVSYSDNSELQIIVSDTGKGISKKQLNHIFTAFEQSEEDRPYTKHYEGLGLGLSITAKIIQLMTGTIKVDSIEGKGSTFSLSIPAKRINTQKKPLVDFSKLTALIVEDNQVNAMVLTSFLKKLGVKSEVAVNGKEGVEKHSAGAFDIIFMDVQMPVMNGLEATKEIRVYETDKDTHISIIAVTANAKKNDCIDAGMDGFIQKPVTLEAVGEGMAEVISKNK